jgi:hypothetical protein
VLVVICGKCFFCGSGTLVPAGDRCSRIEWYLVGVVLLGVVPGRSVSRTERYLLGVVPGVCST